MTPSQTAPGPATPAYASARSETEWTRVYSLLASPERLILDPIILTGKSRLAQCFYDNLLADPEAGPRLSHTLVSERLHASLQRWMVQLLCPAPDAAIADTILTQKKVGEVHARINIPMHLVTRGTRILKTEIALLLRASPLSRLQLSLAHQYVDNLFDMSIEQMEQAFSKGAERGARSEEAYRLFSLGQNIAAERERQRAALLEWSQSVFFALHKNRDDVELPAILASDFGLWVSHKACALFEGAPELELIRSAITRLDTIIAPALGSGFAGADGQPFVDFQAALRELLFLLNGLFDAASEIENGRDTVTQLLSRKFVATVLRREIALASRTGGQFALVMLDIDHFKSVNDKHGHDGGDIVLRHVAEIIQNQSRSSDFVFRYGGEEILMLLVDVNAQQAMSVANKLRANLAEHSFNLPGGAQLQVTASFGVAAFDGHPDYQHLVRRADQALYQAKESGRNQVALAN